MDDDGHSDTPGGSDPDSSYKVMELFGVELKVRNSRLADMLTMEATKALSTDVRQLLDPATIIEVRETLSEALPDCVIAPESLREHDVAKHRHELRSRADGIAGKLGFDVAAGGVWQSPSGISIVTRVVDASPSFASAVDLAVKLSGVLSDQPGPDVSALLVVDSQQTVDVCKVAIRQRRLYDVMRTISIDNLETIRALFSAGAIDHARALVLLSPLADVDIGEVLSIVRSAAGQDPTDVPAES